MNNEKNKTIYTIRFADGTRESSSTNLSPEETMLRMVSTCRDCNKMGDGITDLEVDGYGRWDFILNP